MKRETELTDVKLGTAARRINTFVAGPRAPRKNSVSKLAEALGLYVDHEIKEQKEEYKLDVRKATEAKLYGGSVFTNAVSEATADYEEIKNQFQTVDEAADWFLTRTMPQDEITDPHTLAGFTETRDKALGKFRGKHAEYLAKEATIRRTRDVMNDFMFHTNVSDIDEAFKRLNTVADNYGMAKDKLDEIAIGTAEILMAQHKFETAKAILTHNRGPAGSLVSRGSTALEANKLLAKIKTEDTLLVANQIKALEDLNEAGTEYSDVQRVVLDGLLTEGHITVTKRNNLLQKNEEAVRIDRLQTQIAENLTTPGKSFFDPIAGVNHADAEKSRKKFTQSFYDDIENKRTKGQVNPESYINRVVTFSEQTNSTNPALKARLGAGFAAFNPNAIIQSGEIDQATLASVGEYMALYGQNPQIAEAYTPDSKSRDFFDAIVMDVQLGGLPGSVEEQIALAVTNYANDSLNPLKGNTNVTVSKKEIISKFNTITDDEAGWWWKTNSGKAQNASQWVPYIQQQVKAAARRTGVSDVDKLIKHTVTQVVKRSQRIGDYLVPKGTNTHIGNHDDISHFNDIAVKNYLQNNPEDGYEEGDLVLAPVVGQKNMWAVTVKGSNMPLEIISHNDLPITLGGQAKQYAREITNDETNQIVKDEGVVKDSEGNHISYEDHLGNLTAGHGHLLTPEERKKYPKGTAIPQDVVDEWLEQDLKEAEEDVSSIFGNVKDPELHAVLKNMAFNMGRTRLNQFNDLKKAVRSKDYPKIASAMRNSDWFKQVGNRSRRLVDRIEQLS